MESGENLAFVAMPEFERVALAILQVAMFNINASKVPSET